LKNPVQLCHRTTKLYLMSRGGEIVASSF